MTDAPHPHGGEASTDASTKPSIAQVAAWLRRAAEQRDSVEDLMPAPRPPAPATTQSSAGWDAGQGGRTSVAEELPGQLRPAPEHSSVVEVDQEPAEALAGAEGPETHDELRASGGPAEPEGSDTPSEVGTTADAGAAEEPPIGHVDDLALVGPPPAEDPPTIGEAPPTEVPVVEEAFYGRAPAADKEEIEADAEVTLVGPAAADERADDEVAVAAERPEPLASGLAPMDEPAPVRAVPAELAGPAEETGPDRADAADSPDAAEDAVPLVEVGGAGHVDVDLDPHGGPPGEGGEATSMAADRGGAPARASVTDDRPGAAVEEAKTEAAVVEAPIRDDLEVAPEPDGQEEAATAAPGEATRPEPGLESLSAGSSSVASLFDLDLAELAARARASAEARMASIAPPPSGYDIAPPVEGDALVSSRTDARVGSQADRDTGTDLDTGTGTGTGTGSYSRTEAATSAGWVVEDDLDVRESRPTVTSRPESRQAPFDHTSSPELVDDEGHDHDDRAVVDLRRGDADERRLVAADADLAEETGERPDQPVHRPAAGLQKATPPASALTATAGTRLRGRQVKRNRYPRGQLKERIGILRRVRAMLGVVVLTVVLGVAAGAAIGAFFVFLAFAIRGSITSG